MRRGSRWALGAGLTVVAVVGIVAGSPEPSAGQGAARPRPVFVTNGTGAPVPTAPQGTTAVEGVVGARQQGLWRVEVGGTPDVFVANAEPLTVRIEGGVSPRTHGDIIDVQTTSRVAQLFRYVGGGTNGPSGMSTGRSDAAGDAGGSVTFPTGVVIEPGTTLCLKLTDASSTEIALGVVHGFLSPA